MEDVVIVAAARTAVGKFGGALAKVAAPELGATVIKSLLARSGISGDMALGALLDAGLPIDALRAELGKLDLAGWSLDAERGMRRFLAGTRARVHAPEQDAHRHLADVRPVEVLPNCQRMEGVLVVAPVDLLVAKVLSIVGRTKTAKSLIDRADAHRLPLQFPDLKSETGPVASGLRAAGASAEALATWKQLVAEEIVPEAEDDGY